MWIDKLQISTPAELKRIQTIFETEGYTWTPCRPQNTAWAAEKKLAKQEHRDPRFELFPMEIEKQQHKETKQLQELTEQEQLEAEDAKQKFLASRLQKSTKPVVEPNTVSIDLSNILPSKNIKAAKHPPAAGRVIETKNTKSNKVTRAAAKILSPQEIKEQKLREFVESSQRKMDNNSKKIAEIAKRQREIEAEKRKAAEKIVNQQLKKARVVPSNIPVTDDNECFKYPEKIKKAK
jgi:hypothetical protein